MTIGRPRFSSGFRVVAAALILTVTTTQAAPLWADPVLPQPPQEERHRDQASLEQMEAGQAADQADLAQRQAVMQGVTPPSNLVSILPDATLRRLIRQAEEEYHGEEDVTPPPRAVVAPQAEEAPAGDAVSVLPLQPATQPTGSPQGSVTTPGTVPEAMPPASSPSPAASSPSATPPSSPSGGTSTAPPAGTSPVSSASIIPPGGTPPTQPPQAAPLRLQIEKLSTGVQLTIHGAPGSTFRIDVAEAVTGPWVSLASETIGASGTAQLADRRPDADRRFYRAEVLPTPTLPDHRTAPTAKRTSPGLTNQPTYTPIVEVTDNHDPLRTLTLAPVTLKEGTNPLSVDIVDAAGNTATVTLEPVFLDTILPVATPTIIDGRDVKGVRYVMSSTVKGRFAELADTGSGIAAIEVSVDGEKAWTSLVVAADDKTFTVTLPSGEGERPVQIRVRDRAGNTVTKALLVIVESPLLLDRKTDKEVYDFRSGEPWRLGHGTHGFIVEPTAGGTTWRRAFVTRTGALPELKNPEALPDGPRVTQTTADKQVNTYINGQLMMAERPDGSRIVRPMLDAKGQIISGWLTTPDGALTYLDGGAAAWRREANNGPITWYFPDGVPEAAQTQGVKETVSTGVPSPDVAYAYKLNAAGQVTETLVTTPDTSTLYDAQGRPLVQLHATGRRLTYQNGRPSRIESPGQSSVDYAERTEGGRIVVERPATTTGPEPFPDLPRRLVYVEEKDSAGKTQMRLLEATQGDGKILKFPGATGSDGGPIPTGTLAITDPKGVVTQVRTNETGTTSVLRDGIARQYDPTGSLTMLGFGTGQQLRLAGEKVSGVAGLPDGATVTDGVFSADNHLVSGLVTFPDGRTVRYANRKPTEAQVGDTTKITYNADGQPAQLTLLTTRLTYTIRHGSHRPGVTAPHWVADLLGKPPSPETLRQLVYTEEWKLQEATRDDDAQLTYQDGRLVTLTQSNGAVTTYYYDSTGHLMETITRFTDSKERPLRTDYAYDRPRKVFKGEEKTDKTLTYEYTYETDEQGREITAIRDVETHIVKRYRDSLLVSQTDADGAVTTYEYTANPAGFKDVWATAIEATQQLPSGAVAHYSRGSDGRWVLDSVTESSGRRMDQIRWGADGVLDAVRVTDREVSHDLARTQIIEQSKVDSYVEVGADGGNIADIAQRIVLPGSGALRLKQLALFLWFDVNRGQAEPVGGLRIEVYPDVNSVPPLPLTAPLASMVLDPPHLGAWNRVAFSGDTRLTAGTPYWIVVRYAGTITGSSQAYRIGIQRDVEVLNTLLRKYPESSGPPKWAPITYGERYRLAYQVGVEGDRAAVEALEPLLAAARLPSDDVSVRRMADRGVLRLVPPTTSPTGGNAAAPSVLARSTVTYQGKARESFTYRYQNGLTLVTDHGGATRTYDAARQLVAIDQPDGTRYEVVTAHDLSASQRQAMQALHEQVVSYTAPGGQRQTVTVPKVDASALASPGGSEVTVQYLARRRLADGTELFFDLGRLKEIRLPDGHRLTNVQMDADGLPLRGTLTLPTGEQKPLQSGALTEVVRSDGVRLRYRNDVLVEAHVPIGPSEFLVVTRPVLDGAGHIVEGEGTLPNGDRLVIHAGKIAEASLSTGGAAQQIGTERDELSRAVIYADSAQAALSDARTLLVTLPSGQQYQYRYATDPAGHPTDTVEAMTFRDDFQDGNALGWSVVQSNAPNDWSVSNGDFRGVELNNSDSTPHIFAQTGLNWKDYTVTTHLTYEQTTGKSNEAQLLFRWQNAQNFYRVRIMSAGGWHARFDRWTGGAESFSQDLPALPNFNSAADHTLSVRAQGSTFTIFVDGVQVGQVTDSNISVGSVGFGVRTAIVRFHDIEVTFPGDDLRDPLTHRMDDRLRTLRSEVSKAQRPLTQVSSVPVRFDAATVPSASVHILGESSDPDIREAVQVIQQLREDAGSPVVSELNANGRVLTSVALDGSVAVYDDAGRPSARYDAAGRLQMTYAYNAQGYFTKVTYVAARAQLAEQVAAARADVQRRITQALEAAAKERGLQFQSFQREATAAREVLANTRAALETQLRDIESTDAHGGAGRSQKSEVMDQIRNGLGRVQEAQRQLEAQYAQSLQGFSGELQRMKADAESATAAQFANIDAGASTFLQQILRQELEPILYQQFRIGIGRDPSEDEINAVVKAVYAQAGNDPAKALLDLGTVQAKIQASLDYKLRQDQVDLIKQQVSERLLKYVKATTTPEQRAQEIRSLGLGFQEAVPLTQADAEKILAWLKSRSLHFGHSAFLALQEFLKGQSSATVPDTVTLATELILTDILVGVLNPKVQAAAELEISLYTLQLATRRYKGQAIAAHVTLQDLRTLLAAGPVIAHVNGNHYLVVTAITADGKIIYSEPNKGPIGERGLTMSRQAFARQWQGIVLSPRPPPQEAQRLTDDEAQAITGSFFPFLIPLFIAIFSTIGAAVSAVIGAIGAVLASLGTLLSGVFSAFSAAVGGLFNGLGLIASGNLLGGLSAIGNGLFLGVTGLVNAGLGFLGFGSLSQIGTLAGLKTALVNFAIHTVLTTGVNFAVSRGLEALGVSPQLAGVVGAFAGGFVAGLNPTTVAGTGAAASSTAAAGSFWRTALGSGITSAAIAGTQLGLAHLGLDPALASIASVGIGTVTNGLITKGLAGLGTVLKTQLAPTLTGELAYYGVQKLGESAGLDPRLTAVIGAPVRAGLNPGVDPNTGQARTVPEAMSRGLLQGVSSIGVQFATQGLDPSLGALTSAAVTGAIDGLVSPNKDPKTGQPIDKNHDGKIDAQDSKGIFAGISESFTRTAGGFADIGVVKPNDPSGNATRLGQLNDFSALIANPKIGLGGALDTYAASLLHRSSIESILNAGTSVKQYTTIKDAIDAKLPTAPETSLDGKPVKKLAYGDALTLYYDPKEFRLAGIQENELLTRYQEIRHDPATHTVGMATGSIEQTYLAPDGKTVTARVRQEIAGADIQSVTIEVKDGTKRTITPNSFAHVRLSADGAIQDGILTDPTSGAKYYFQSGQQIGVWMPALSVGTPQSPLHLQPLPPSTVLMPDQKVTAGDLQGLSVEVTKDLSTGQAQTRIVPTNPNDAAAVGRLQNVLSRVGQNVQEGAERLTNAALFLGPSTTTQMAANKTAEVGKVVADPSKLYLLHTKTNSPTGYTIRAGTFEGILNGATDSVDHSALAFQGPDGQIYVVDITDTGHLETGLSTDVRVNRLQDWAKPYADIQAQALPLTADKVQDVKFKSIFATYADINTMKPKIDLRYDMGGAILGAGASLPITPQPDAKNICTNLTCDILDRAGIKIPGLPSNQYVTPNQERRAVDAWIKQSQNQQ